MAWEMFALARGRGLKHQWPEALLELINLIEGGKTVIIERIDLDWHNPTREPTYRVSIHVRKDGPGIYQIGYAPDEAILRAAQAWKELPKQEADKAAEEAGKK
jgi:hypothetical protein